MTVEHTILSQLLLNDEYARTALPHLRSSYFEEPAEKAVFKTYVEFWNKYNVAPTKEALRLEISNRDDISDQDFEDAIGIVDHSLNDGEEEPHEGWLIDITEQWCQDRAVHNAVMDAIAIIDGEDENRTKHAIPDILKEALSVSFNSNIGHDYLEDAESRYDYYHEELARLPFDIKLLNEVTNGGVPDGTLNILLAGTNVGKTLTMIHFASSYIQAGKNVLYITLEMSEQEIARRIDANIFSTKVNDVEKMDKSKFTKGIHKIRAKTNGKLIIKQFPTGAAHSGHFRALIQELYMKKGFAPDVIFIDYIGICASSRVKLGNTGSYFYVKAIAEELRGMGIEHECPVWSAVQATRGGYSNTDMDITDTAESFGLPATADLMLGVIRTDDLDALGQILFRQLKNRYGNKSFKERFVIGINAEKQQLYNLEDSAQDNIYQGPKTKNKKSEDSDDPTQTEKKSKFGDFDKKKKRNRSYE